MALLAYAPSLTIPLIADDYPNLSQSLTYGAPGGVGTLLHDAQFRLRATSYWAMYGLWQAAGLTPWVYHTASLLLHIANTWLVFFVAAAWPRMRPAAFWAAAFFAVHEGHQEAVMWFSAINELLMFLFGMASLWCWRSAPDSARPAWLKELAGVALFALALLSKESAIFLLPLFVLVVEPAQWRTRLPRLAAASDAGPALPGLDCAEPVQLVSIHRRQLFPACPVLAHLAAQLRPPAVDLGMAGRRWPSSSLAMRDPGEAHWPHSRGWESRSYPTVS